jgi:hypothetical protein
VVERAAVEAVAERAAVEATSAWELAAATALELATTGEAVDELAVSGEAIAIGARRKAIARNLIFAIGALKMNLKNLSLSKSHY